MDDTKSLLKKEAFACLCSVIRQGFPIFDYSIRDFFPQPFSPGGAGRHGAEPAFPYSTPFSRQ
jgi:hypothetical protein